MKNMKNNSKSSSKENKIKISPENKMKKSEAEKLDTEKPIIHLEENKAMPLYIFTATLAAPFMDNEMVNIMASIIHLIDLNK